MSYCGNRYLAIGSAALGDTFVLIFADQPNALVLGSVGAIFRLMVSSGTIAPSAKTVRYWAERDFD